MERIPPALLAGTVQRLSAIRDPDEIGPDHVIEDVALQGIHCFGKAVDGNAVETRPEAFSMNIGKVGNVIQVAVWVMEDMADSGLIVGASPETQAPGVYSQDVVHQVTAGVLFGFSTLLKWCPIS